MPMLSGVRAEWGVRGTVEGDMGENWEGEGAGEEMGWVEGGAEGGGMRVLNTLEDGWLEAGVCAWGVCGGGCCCVCVWGRW